MAQYQKGDKVLVRSDLVAGEKYAMDSGVMDAFMSDMEFLLGKVVTINKVSDKYRIEEFNYNWTDEMFEGLASDLGGFAELNQTEFLNLL